MSATRHSLIPDGVPQWQPDEEASVCPLCSTAFSLFFRRHHCRKCGRVVCSGCSSHNMTYLPSTYVVCPPSQIFLETPHVPHRTCDECAEELDMIREALRARTPQLRPRSTASSSPHSRASAGQGPSSQQQRLEPNAASAAGIKRTSEPIVEAYAVSSSCTSTHSDSTNGTSHAHPIPTATDDDNDVCPVCGLFFPADTLPPAREAHINTCLTTAQFSGTPDQTLRANRMIIYRLSPKEAHGLTDSECVVCFEEFKAGDMVGRLECLCVYHEKCILDWFGRKGAGKCPVHAVNP